MLLAQRWSPGRIAKTQGGHTEEPQHRLRKVLVRAPLSCLVQTSCCVIFLLRLTAELLTRGGALCRRFAASYPSSTSHQGTAATENEIAEALKALSEGSRILIDTMERLVRKVCQKFDCFLFSNG